MLNKKHDKKHEEKTVRVHPPFTDREGPLPPPKKEPQKSDKQEKKTQITTRQTKKSK